MQTLELLMCNAVWLWHQLTPLLGLPPGHCDFGKDLCAMVKSTPQPSTWSPPVFFGVRKWTKQGVSHRQTASAGSSLVQAFLMHHSFLVFLYFVPIIRLPGATSTSSQPEGDRWSSREASVYRAWSNLRTIKTSPAFLLSNYLKMAELHSRESL